MNPRAKQNTAGLQIVDIRKADVTTIVNGLDLKPLGADGLALLEEAARNIAVRFEYKDGEEATNEQTILTILATYLADFVEKTSPVAGGTAETKLKGVGTPKSTRTKRTKDDEPNGGFQGGSSEVVSHAA